MSTGPVELQGITINAGILETLQGFSTQRNVLKGVTIAVGTGAQIMQLKVVDRNHEPIEGATCRVLNAIFGSNNVLSFDGVDDYVSSAKMTPSGDYTIMFWVWFDGLGDYWICNERNNTSTLQNFQMARSSTRKGGIFQVNNTSGTWFSCSFGSDSVDVNTEEWIHFAATLDRGNSKIQTFKNGVFANETTFTGTSRDTNSNIVLGKYGWGSGGWFDGKISDFRVYNAALSEAQIQTVMNQRAIAGGNLTNYWKIDEGEGSTLNDSIGAINGTIFGATWAEADESFPLPIGIQGYDPTPYDSQTTNANGLTTLNYQINRIHGLEVTLPGKRRFIMPFQRTTRGLLEWQVMLSDYLATFATDRGNILINSEPENNDANFLIE